MLQGSKISIEKSTLNDVLKKAFLDKLELLDKQYTFFTSSFNLEDCNVKELRQHSKLLGLGTSGKKDVLIQAIQLKLNPPPKTETKPKREPIDLTKLQWVVIENVDNIPEEAGIVKSGQVGNHRFSGSSDLKRYCGRLANKIQGPWWYTVTKQYVGCRLKLIKQQNLAKGGKKLELEEEEGMEVQENEEE
jgi:hypothetical protein